MKHFYLMLVLAIASTTGFSQISILMKIPGITAAAGDKVTAFEGDAIYPVPVTGAAGPAAMGNIMIKKPLSISSQLIKNFLLGTHLATVEFDFIDNTNTMIYSVQLGEAMLTKFSNLAPECPTCQSLSNEIWFNFTTITYNDPVNKKVITFNVKANTVE